MNRYFFFGGFAFLYGMIQPGWAEVSYVKMRGVHQLVAPRCEALSPIYGFSVLKQEVLPQIRFFGNYGPERKEYACGTQIRAPTVYSVFDIGFPGVSEAGLYLSQLHRRAHFIGVCLEKKQRTKKTFWNFSEECLLVFEKKLSPGSSLAHLSNCHKKNGG